MIDFYHRKLYNKPIKYKPQQRQSTTTGHPVKFVNHVFNGYTSDFTGRLGNHMFIYAYVRSLAEIEKRPFRLKSDLLQIAFNVMNESPTMAHIYTRPYGTLYYQEKENFDLLLSNRSMIRQWFKPSNFGKVFLEQRGYPTVVNTRGGDFIGLGWSLSKEYYQKAINGQKNILFVTDDVNHTKNMFGDNYEIVHTSDDWSILYHAKRIIMSISTYCWWGSFLSDKESVIVPSNDWVRTSHFVPFSWSIQNLNWEQIKP